MAPSPPPARHASASGQRVLVPTLSRTPMNRDDEDDDDENEDYETAFDGRRKTLGRALEHRIRNSGFADDIMEGVAPLQPKAQHMNHVNTILHVCILRRDWARAKRAFKLLLRSDREQDVTHLRLKNIWKMGVEILSWETKERPALTGSPGTRADDCEEAPRDYTKVMEYMGRLVIMYPYYKHYVIGKGVNATTIMPILMHFEVLALQERLSIALANNDNQLAGILAVVSGILAATNRLKVLQETPPWIDMVDLWKLRGQLHIWAADLSARLLNDTKTHVRHRILAHRVARKMRERGLSGWEEFIFGDEEAVLDDEMFAEGLLQDDDEKGIQDYFGV
ncbi:hypothetical protein DRE_04585 [Drechslerella stenobrocha 248]|uniref:Uncharacterized protein n=1 Tax=Drechslerella stenobrocha 248 TaxID=1043628 RepID=W7I110_9PEZI|nr:hypothetical protein DRE_04585 [Drechslerella stenobrocha 248]